MGEVFKRYYGGMLRAQEKWLNKMAAEGYRLVRTGKLDYEFDRCSPGAYQYKVEYVGLKSRESADDYAKFLEDCGYKVFFKNINLNSSIGKVVIVPWADKGGRIVSAATTYNRELLIVEKQNDGREFELHSTREDRLAYCRSMRKSWIFFFLFFAAMAVGLRSWVAGVFAAAALAVLGVFWRKLYRIRREDRERE